MRKFSAVTFVLLMAASAVAQIFNLTITKSNGEKVVTISNKRNIK